VIGCRRRFFPSLHLPDLTDDPRPDLAGFRGVLSAATPGIMILDPERRQERMAETTDATQGVLSRS